MSTHIISTSEMFEYANESRLRRLPHILSKNGWERVDFYNILASKNFLLPLAPHFCFFLVIFPRGSGSISILRMVALARLSQP